MMRCQGARELMAVMWGQELSSALKQTSSRLEESYDEGSVKPDSKARTFGIRLKAALSAVWKDGATDVFESRYVCLPLTNYRLM